ncbi:vanadium-dependent haloperoxidase [Sinorhizobium meliloti]|uniref:vanadium-dependent haloperoxidase n=1 Tax=Rhizobium meliloti TaxID=382 RepID=UPI000FDC4170|nr:vanadium-dependent haloperoxidase [Sinorhizobium meliloti]RVO65711.1 hypothetical protein CN087_20260 [Sinorhizobium meliloti]
MADAVHYAYGASFKPFFSVTPPKPIERPELFVGGAIAAILSHIYSTPAHSFLIGNRRVEFLKATLGEDIDLSDWKAGEEFGSDAKFKDQWKWDEIRERILPPFSTYLPRPRRHNADPFNPSQGFYGERWGEQTPFVADTSEVHVDDPPDEGTSEYDSDLAYVRVKGALSSVGTPTIPARTAEETNIGLFWAYDGARLIGTPPRLYNQIVRIVAERDGLDQKELARLLALINIAMADAGIVAWKAKYEHAIWRPVLGIQNLASGADADWKPYGSPRTNSPALSPNIDVRVREVAQTFLGAGGGTFSRLSQGWLIPQLTSPSDDDLAFGRSAFTPNFPAYPSGHATFGSACFNALKEFRRQRASTSGDPDSIRGEFISDELNGISVDHMSGLPRPLQPFEYTSINEMIRDNDRSRVFLGVHWMFDATAGSKAGEDIAMRVVNSAYTSA